jgi:Flp pilus assembly protein protease CpaA
MTPDGLLVGVGLFGLIVGSITDIQKREVADWVNYFLIYAGLGIRLITAIWTNEWSYFLYGLLGFGIFFGLAYLMFFTGQWGGGDSKMLMGMGALFATAPVFLIERFNPNLIEFPFLVSFWINLLLVGAVYGILWTIGLGIVHFTKTKKAFKEWLAIPSIKKMRLYTHILAGVLLLAAVFIQQFMIRLTGLVFGGLILFFFYMYITIKAVEQSAMYRSLPPSQLVEGDWPLEDVIVDNKVIFSVEKKIGIELDDLETLRKLEDQGKIKKIDVRHGVPFVPSFLFAFIVTSVYGNLIVLLL